MPSNRGRARGITWLLAGIAMLATCLQAQTTQPATAPADARRLTFPDAVTLVNDHIRVDVAPTVGRITYFGRVEGENLIWINTPEDVLTEYRRGGVRYRNVGGDKIWPTAQALWARAFGGNAPDWPPDGIIDGQPWTLVDQSAHHAVMQSPLAAHLGIQVRREITLHEREPRVTIENTITRHKASVFPVQIWTVTQAHWPRFVLLDVAQDRPGEAAWVPFGKNLAPLVHSIGDDAAILFTIDRSRDTGQKIGTLGRWLAAVWDDQIWYQSTAFDPTGMYPDASSVQAYYDGVCSELELLSPMVHLQPGESLRNTVVWWLVPRDGLTDRQIAEKAEHLSTGVKPASRR